MAEGLEIQVVSNADGLGELELTAAPDAVQALFDRVFQEAVSTAQRDTGLRLAEKIPPWEPIPDEVVLDRYRPSINRSVETSLVDWCIAAAAEELDLAFADRPIVAIDRIAHGEPVTVRLTCFVVPTIPASALDGLEVAREPIPVDETAIDAAVDELRRTMAIGTRVDRPAAPRDRVELDLESKSGEVRLPLGTFTHGFMDLVEGSPAGAVVDELIGAEAGDIVPFAVRAADDPAVAVEVRARVREVQGLELPAADDAFAKQHGADSLDDLRNKLRANLEERLRLIDEGRVLAQVAAHVVERVEIPVPETLARRRFAAELEGLMASQVQRGVAPSPPSESEIEALYERAAPDVREQTRAALVVLGLARQLRLRVPAAQVRAFVLEEAARLGIPRERSTKILQDRVRLEAMRLRLVRSRLVDRLVE
jgi:trigger factor